MLCIFCDDSVDFISFMMMHRGTGIEQLYDNITLCSGSTADPSSAACFTLANSNDTYLDDGQSPSLPVMYSNPLHGRVQCTSKQDRLGIALYSPHPERHLATTSQTASPLISA